MTELPPPTPPPIPPPARPEKRRGVPVAGCVVIALVAGGLGFIGGFASSEFGGDILEGMFAYEEKAETSMPNLIKRELYQLEYPGNWSLDKEEEEFDLDNYFTIDTPGGSYVMLLLAYYDSDPVENVQFQQAHFNDVLGQPVTASFTTYGRYTGEGRQLKGRIFGLPATVEVFSSTVGDHSFTLIEVVYDEDRKLVEPGLKMIEDSFDFHPPVKPMDDNGEAPDAPGEPVE